MIRFLKAFCLLLCFMGPALAAEESYEEVGEFIKLDVVFQGKASGLIWAYECLDCTPKRFLFDNRTVVELTRFSTRLGVEGLDGIDGQSAVMTWIPNTTQVLRVLPMGF